MKSFYCSTKIRFFEHLHLFNFMTVLVLQLVYLQKVDVYYEIYLGTERTT